MTEIAQSLNEDGFVVMPGIVPTAVLQAVWDEIAQVFSQTADQLGFENIPATDLDNVSRMLVQVFEADRSAYFATAKLAQHLASLQNLSTNPVILDVLKDLGVALPTISTRQVLHIVSSRLRVDGGYDKTPPHQDWRSVQGSLNGLTLWVPFRSTAPGEHALEVARGSHRSGLLPSTDHPFGHAAVESEAAKFDFEEIVAKRGDLVVLSNFTLHRTGESGGERVRVAASFRYNDATEPTFIERRYPNPYIYKPDMRLLTPDFPEPNQIMAALKPRGSKL